MRKSMVFDFDDPMRESMCVAWGWPAITIDKQIADDSLASLAVGQPQYPEVPLLAFAGQSLKRNWSLRFCWLCRMAISLHSTTTWKT